MRASTIAAFAAGAVASYAPPVYGESSSSSVESPSYYAPSSTPAPVYEPITSEAPVYTPTSTEVPVVSSAPSVYSSLYYTSAQVYPTYTTKVVSSLTTYCPGPTSITYGATTYTVTEATTLTITDCPCTVTEPITYGPATTPAPVYTSPSVYTSTWTTTETTDTKSVTITYTSVFTSYETISAGKSTVPAVPTAPAPYPTGPAGPVYPSGSGTGKVTPSAYNPSNSGSTVGASFAGLAAVFGVVAYFL